MGRAWSRSASSTDTGRIQEEIDLCIHRTAVGVSARRLTEVQRVGVVAVPQTWLRASDVGASRRAEGGLCCGLDAADIHVALGEEPERSPGRGDGEGDAGFDGGRLPRHLVLRPEDGGDTHEASALTRAPRWRDTRARRVPRSAGLGAAPLCRAFGPYSRERPPTGRGRHGTLATRSAASR